MRDADRQQALERLDAADDHRRAMQAVEVLEARREIGDGEGRAVRSDDAGAHDGAVALVDLVGEAK